MYTYHASATRWLKRYSAPTLIPVTATAAAVSEAQNRLLAAPWKRVEKDLRATVAPPRPAIGSIFSDASRDNYFDAYFGCDDHTEDGGVPMHRVHAGAVCYRIELPAAAVGVAVTSIKATVTCDYLTPQGAHVAVELSTSDVPDPSLVRTGTAYASAIAPRTVSADRRTGYGATAVATLTMPANTVLTNYVYVYLSLESVPAGLSGWLDGSTYITPDFEIVTSELITGYADGAEIGGGYETAASGTMVISGGELPAPWSAVPYREIAVIQRDIWEQPPVPTHLILSSYNQWLAATPGQFAVSVTSLPSNFNTFSLGALPTWLTASINTATNIVTFIATAAEPGVPRSCDVIFTSGPETATLHVDQQADEITYLAVTPAYLYALRAGGDAYLLVTSLPNGELTFTAEKPAAATWLTLEVDAVDPNKIKVTTAAQSVGAFARQTVVTFTSGSSIVNIDVAQQSGEAITTLALSQSTYAVGPSANNLSNNVVSFPNGYDISDVSVLESPNWITSTIDVANNQIDCSVAGNGGGVRVGQVRVACNGEIVSFQVTQEKSLTALSVSPAGTLATGDGGVFNAVLTLPPGSGAATFEVTTGGVTGISGVITGTDLAVTIAASTSARDVVCTISCTADSVPYTATYTIRQGGRTTTELSTRLAKLTPTAVASLATVAGADTTVKYVATDADTCVITGTFTNISGWRAACPITIATGVIPTCSTDIQNYFTSMLADGKAPACGFNRTFKSFHICGKYGTPDNNSYGIYFDNSAYRRWGNTAYWGSPTVPEPVTGQNRFATDGSTIFAISTTNKKAYKWAPTYNAGISNPSVWFTAAANPSAIAYFGSQVYVAGNGVTATGNLGVIAPSGTQLATVTATTKVPPSNRFTPDNWTELTMAFDASGSMIVAGAFENIGGNAVKYLAKWDGNNWVPYSTQMPAGAVKSMASYAGGLVVLTTASTQYYSYTAPLGALKTGLEDSLPAVFMAPRQAVYGVRDLYADAFAGQILPYDFTSEVRPARQTGICACLRRQASTTTSPDIARLILSAQFAHMELPETFAPSTLVLSTPTRDLLNLPDGTLLDVTIWWAKDTLLTLADLAAVNNSATWWSGRQSTVSGTKAISLGQTNVVLKAALKRIGRVTLNADAVALDSIDVPLQGLDGLYGTLVITAWLRADTIAALEVGVKYGIGAMDADSNGITGADSCWRPDITLIE